MGLFIMKMKKIIIKYTGNGKWISIHGRHRLCIINYFNCNAKCKIKHLKDNKYEIVDILF